MAAVCGSRVCSAINKLICASSRALPAMFQSSRSTETFEAGWRDRQRKLGPSLSLDCKLRSKADRGTSRRRGERTYHACRGARKPCSAACLEVLRSDAPSCGASHATHRSAVDQSSSVAGEALSVSALATSQATELLARAAPLLRVAHVEHSHTHASHCLDLRRPWLPRRRGRRGGSGVREHVSAGDTVAAPTQTPIAATSAVHVFCSFKRHC